MSKVKLRVVSEWGGCSWINPMKGKVFEVARETKCYYFIKRSYPSHDVEVKIRKSDLRELPRDPWFGRIYEVVGE